MDWRAFFLLNRLKNGLPPSMNCHAPVAIDSSHFGQLRASWQVFPAALRFESVVLRTSGWLIHQLISNPFIFSNLIYTRRLIQQRWRPIQNNFMVVSVFNPKIYTNATGPPASKTFQHSQHCSVYWLDSLFLFNELFSLYFYQWKYFLIVLKSEILLRCFLKTIINCWSKRIWKETGAGLL